MQHCWPTTPNIVGFHSVHLFAHPVAGCCVLLNLESLKQVKLLSQQLLNILICSVIAEA